MADYTSTIYLDDIIFGAESGGTNYTETCIASIINTPHINDTWEVIESTIHNHTPSTASQWTASQSATTTIINSSPIAERLDIILVIGTIHNHTPEIIAMTGYNEGDTDNITMTPAVSAIVAPLILGDVTSPTENSALLISGSVNKTISDKMWRATFDFETAAEAYLRSTEFKTAYFLIPDLTNTARIVFFGILPSSSANLAVADDRCTLTAYDHAWYLTMQYLTLADRVLLSLDDQSAVETYRLNYDYCTNPYLNFAEGDIVIGGTSGDSGKVLENHFSGNMGTGYLILGDVTGTPVSGHYFNDNEDLDVNGVTIANANGYTMDWSSEWATYYPEEWVRRILGGDNWEKTTGIYPYRLANSATLWNTIQRTFTFEEKTTKYQAIEQVAKYMGYIFVVKFRFVGDRYMPLAYFIPQDEIDYLIANGDPNNGLDLPTSDPVGITVLTPNDFVNPVNYEEKGEEKYNRVTVKCSDSNGIWYTSKSETSGVQYGDEIPVEYFEINSEIASQAEADQRCSDLFTYYVNHIKKWNITLIKRSDLELYQKVNLGAFGTEIPSGNYRIIAIEYRYGEGGISNETQCTIIPDAQFHAYLNLSRTFTDTISEIRAIVQDELNRLEAIEAGTVTAIDGSTVTIQTERGVVKIARDPTV